ncbi:hypothetical protein TCAL_02562 [Tigriopus californicus]|uniref:BTB domain-containing protein n=1 Tax=Tigriopus californicus TaxID=6832 RepID=A0A553P6B7_TIGCA|nr:protein tramtrack, alpha isoform-like isoform X3 [Tigriopus californicus]TRY73237.1 hypothetical protein TCAL_02562 [Tigriopus californicus]|eukprot:TCALIF_02562-PA protein Name:"Similar to bab2 Protein bric-a-brac 2 (Drosophila melanogaster)" AED:0.05 eAED:0.05 QI:412/1/1/1/1/1/5/1508/718
MNLSIASCSSSRSRSPSPYYHHQQNQKCSVEVVIELDVLKNVLPQLSIAKMDPVSQVFCLRWNNHRSNLLNVFDLLLQTEAFCDVTLACDGASIKCHKIILSACSSYFQQLFMENSCEHPIVFLKDIKYNDIRSILAYMYKGEVNVQQEELPNLLKVAELLKVKGLVEEEREKLLSSGLKDPRSSVSTTDDHEPRPSTASSTKNNKDGPNSKDNGPLTPTSAGPNMVPPFMCTPPGSRPQIPMWPLHGMFPGAHGLFGNGNADHHDKEGSPSPKEVGASKRKKTSSGSGGSTSSKDGNVHNNTNNNLGPGPRERDHEREERNDEKMLDNDLDKDNGMMNMDKNNIANYVPNQRLEWKRYKQYTRNDIMAAIDEVRKGMSALQASRKYGVPSRTLYDKVKKMGIVTGRQMQRKSLPQYPASFPQFGGMMGMDSLKDLSDSRSKDMDENTNDSSSQPGDNLDGRATMVPPGGAFPSMQMLSIMEKMKESERRGDSEISLMPMNLSTMLGSAGSRDLRLATSLASAQHHSQSDREGGAPGGNGHSRGGRGEMSESSLSPGGDDVDIDEEGDDDIVESSSGNRGRDRHSSSDIRAQFMADLRRLGGNVNSSEANRSGSVDRHSSHGNRSGAHPQEEAASSTTHSPPPPASSSGGEGHSPVSKALLPSSRSSEDNLPPRKRKVSQEQHANFNGGLHEDEVSPEKQRSSAPSPIQEQSELDCRN